MAFSLNEEDSQLYLILSSAAKLREKNIEIITACTNADTNVIVVTTNQLCCVLRANYEKHGIPSEKIFFIDMVTRYAGGNNIANTDNCRYINNPSNITDLGIAVTETMKLFEGKKVVLVFDSINSSLMYMPSQKFTKFIHFLTNRLRLSGFSGILLAAEKGLEPELLSQLILFVDTVVYPDFE